jgi:hypothetical protein
MARERISMSGLLLPPNHCSAFSVVGRAAIRSKFFAAALRLEFRDAGSSMMMVILDRNRM